MRRASSIGAPKRRGWRAWLRPSTTTELVRKARGFDVITIGVADEHAQPTARGAGRSRRERPCPFTGIAMRWALATTLICTGIAFAMYPYFELANIVMAYVLGSTIAGVRFGRGPAVVAADRQRARVRFLFRAAAVHVLGRRLPVHRDVRRHADRDAVIANLMASVRQQTRVAGARERRTALLYAMSRELAATRGVANMARVAVRHVAEVFDCKAVVLLPDANGRLALSRAKRRSRARSSRRDLSIAQWVVDHGKRAGLGLRHAAGGAGAVCAA